MIHLLALLLALLLAFPFVAKAEALPKAMEIARKGLEQNVVTVLDRKYLLAGSNQYHSLWAWDFAFASYGALKAGHVVAVRDSFEIYFSFQRPDGLMPRVIDRHGIEVRVLLGLMGIVLPFKDPLRPQFETENGVISYIPNVIFPWSASRYILDTKDTLFARKYFTHAEKAITWMDSNTIENGLICKQQPYSDWEDSVQRTGCVAFTNVLYALSLRGLSDWAKFLGDETKTKYYLNRYNQFLSRFLLYFWDSNKKIIRNFNGDDHLTADANLLAVAYHLLNQKDSEEVLHVLRGSPLWKPWPGRPTWPNYPDSIKSKFPKLVGLSGYHDEIHWGWITALAAIAEKETGHLKESQQILESYAKQIVADGTVHEVYDFEAGTQSLKPVSRLFYQAEQPFTWSSGFFLEAAYH